MFRSTAHVYDLIYEGAGRDYAAEAVAVRDLIGSRLPGARDLLDVACGTGGHLHHLRQWFDVVGVDMDSGMLAEARGRLPDVALVEGDMRSFDLGRRFDAVICLFSSIGYARSTDDLDAAVARMAAHLRPGGALVVDGWIRPEAWIEPGTVNAVAATGTGIAAARVARTRREGRTSHLELHHLVATLDGGVEYLVDHDELTLFERQEYEDAFVLAGLAVERTDSPWPGRDRYVGLAPTQRSRNR